MSTNEKIYAHYLEMYAAFRSKTDPKGKADCGATNAAGAAALAAEDAATAKPPRQSGDVLAALTEMFAAIAKK